MRTRVVGLSIGALALAGACASSTATSGTSRFDASPAPEPTHEAPTRAAVDSMFAQSIADKEGPRVSVRAEVTQFASNRRLRAVFKVEDDAYVLVGHVDAAGVLRIVFPADPHDDGFVQGGGRTYDTPEFFGGFADEYRFRYSNYGRFYGNQPQSYDGGGGYLFIVASWRPMHFEKFTSGDTWDSFNVTDEAYITDPRPAVRELASVLVGDNREAYSVEFASYATSQDVSPFGSYSGLASFGLQQCNASFYGWGESIPWSYLSTAAPFLTTGLGNGTFFYEGRRYAYDSFGDCAVPLPYYSGYSGYGYYASNPFVPGGPNGPISGRARTLSAFDSHRKPFEPRPTGGRIAPEGAHDGGTASQGLAVQVSPEYRHRGLITEDRPESGMPTDRRVRVGTEDQTQAQARPSIQQMTERRAQNAHEGSGYSRARMSDDGQQHSPADRNGGVERTRGLYTNNGSNDNGRSTARPSDQTPRTSAPAPRVESPHVEAPRSAPPMRAAEPRASEPPKSTPPPAAASGSKPTP